MNKRIMKEEVKICDKCKGTGFIIIKNDIKTSCTECNSKGVIKILRFEK